jgi:hypothetical protein
MKLYKIPAHNLGTHPIQDAFNIVFGEETLREIHSKLTVTPWQHDKRTTEFYVKVDMIPRVLRGIFSAEGMHVTVQQNLSKKDASWKVKNNIKMHVLGARFFNISSSFELHKSKQDVFLTGAVKCNAFLLPPLNTIAESFMLSHCKKEINVYTDVITKRFMSVAPS